MTIDATPLVTGRTLHFDWAVIADGSRSAIELTSVGIDYPHPLQNLALRTAILISLRFIAEVGGRPGLIPLFPIRQGNIGTDALVLNGFDVLDGAIFRVAGSLVMLELRREAVTPQQVAHRLVIHDLRRRHQYLEDDARFAAIDDIVGMIPQMRASPFQPHRRRIRIRGADFEVRRSLVKAMHLPLLLTFLCDPIVPSGILAGQFLLLFLREDNGQWHRCIAIGDGFRRLCLWRVSRRGFGLPLLVTSVFPSEQSSQMSLDGCSPLHRKTRSQ